MQKLPKDLKLKTSIMILVLATLGSLSYWAAPETITDKIGPWYSIFPPLIAVSLALVTHRVLESLAASILLGGVLVLIKEGNSLLASIFPGLLKGAEFYFRSATNPTNLQILAFIVAVMVMISLLISSGGLQGVVNTLMRYAKGPRSTQFVTVLMGIAMFIDDYANTMLIGSTMRPATDSQKVSREKLAFLVDATSAPIAGVAIISTWIGYEVGLFETTSQALGLGKDGYSLFFDALPFRFYCFLMVAFLLVNTLIGEDFGPMAKAEKRARDTGKLMADDATPLTTKSMATASADPSAKINPAAALLPLGALVIMMLGGLWWSGGGFQQGIGGLFNWTVWRTTISSANSILVLAWAGFAGAVLAALSASILSKLSWQKILNSILLGLRGSILPVIILISAWSLKEACDGLATGGFLAATVGNVVSPLWFPAILFVVAGVTAFSTGTSWGTMAILIPTAIPIAFSLDGNVYGITTMICLGAVLDGAIFGDHCSPLSDTTIMSSIASDCDHIHHVETQIPYSLLVAAVALIFGYLPATQGVPSFVSILLGTVFFVGLFGYLFASRHGKRIVAVLRSRWAEA